MVRTRSKSLFYERQNQNDMVGEIEERAKNLRQINPKRSPRKRAISKQKRKAKRDSKMFVRLLTNTRETLSKVNIIKHIFIGMVYFSAVE